MGETRFELVTIPPKAGHSTIELFVLIVCHRFFDCSLFPHQRIQLFKTNFILPSPAEDSNFLLSICSRMHTAMSASRTFAESKGFEPLHRISDDGLANHYNTTLSTLQNILRMKKDSNFQP